MELYSAPVFPLPGIYIVRNVCISGVSCQRRTEISELGRGGYGLAGGEVAISFLIGICTPLPHLPGDWAITRTISGEMRTRLSPHSHSHSPSSLELLQHSSTSP
jgi:hypothetical protein